MQKGVVLLLSGGFVCSVLMFALGQFFQIRGVQHMLTSRIFLGIAWLCATLLLWGIVRALSLARWLWIAIIGGIVLLMAAIVLDHAFPMSNSAHSEPPTAKTEQTAKQSSPMPVQTQQEQAKAPGKPLMTEVAKPTPLRPYDLTGRRGEIFLALLSTQLEPRDTVKVGCIGWIEESCVAAGKFLLLFSQAGWKIDSNRVFRFDPGIPPEGMTIASKAPKYTDNLPPHLGHWGAMDTSQVTFWQAFSWMQIPVGASGDPDMPEGTIGIYFGPEPNNVTVRTFRQAQRQLAQLLGMILIGLRAVERTCSTQADACKTKRLQWTQVVSAFLDYCDCGLNKSWSKKWKDASNDANDGPLTIIGRQDKTLQRFIATLNKEKH
jgi:hypothetical protein